jgi:hypothetical protein
VFGLDYDSGAVGIQYLVDGVGELSGHALLKLRTSGHHLQGAGQLARPDHPAILNIPHMSFTEKGEQMMLAHGKEGDVPQHHDIPLVTLLIKDGVETGRRIYSHAGEEFTIHSGHSSRCILQTFSKRVFTHGLED